MKYTIPKEISSEMKFTKSLYLFDIASLVISLSLAYLFSSLVYKALIIPYYIFVLLGTIYLVSKSKANPGKRNFRSIYYAIIRKRNVFSRY